MKIEERTPFSPRDQDFQLDVPSFWPALGQGMVILVAGIGLAALAATAIGGETTSPLRYAGGALFFLGGLFAVVAAANRFRHATSIIGYWTGTGPLRESTGTCRVQQRPDGIWGIRLSFVDSLDSEAEFLEILSSGDLDSGPDTPTPALTDPALFFRHDEAEVAELTRIFDPEQAVSVRWMDLPAAVGGPFLLHMQKTSVAFNEDAEAELLAA